MTSEVLVVEGGIYISDDLGEIVCWVQDEWEEDPTIVPAICNAIKMFYLDGPAALRASINHPVQDPRWITALDVGDEHHPEVTLSDKQWDHVEQLFADFLEAMPEIIVDKSSIECHIVDESYHGDYREYIRQSFGNFLVEVT